MLSGLTAQSMNDRPAALTRESVRLETVLFLACASPAFPLKEAHLKIKGRTVGKGSCCGREVQASVKERRRQRPTHDVPERQSRPLGSSLHEYRISALSTRGDPLTKEAGCHVCFLTRDGLVARCQHPRLGTYFGRIVRKARGTRPFTRVCSVCYDHATTSAGSGKRGALTTLYSVLATGHSNDQSLKVIVMRVLAYSLESQSRA